MIGTLGGDWEARDRKDKYQKQKEPRGQQRCFVTGGEESSALINLERGIWGLKSRFGVISLQGRSFVLQFFTDGALLQEPMPSRA